MSWSDWMLFFVIGLIVSLFGVLLFPVAREVESFDVRSTGLRQNVAVPDTMTVCSVDYVFSPTGGYVHVTYKPKEEMR